MDDDQVWNWMRSVLLEFPDGANSKFISRQISRRFQEDIAPDELARVGEAKLKMKGTRLKRANNGLYAYHEKPREDSVGPRDKLKLEIERFTKETEPMKQQAEIPKVQTQEPPFFERLIETFRRIGLSAEQWSDVVDLIPPAMQIEPAKQERDMELVDLGKKNNASIDHMGRMLADVQKSQEALNQKSIDFWNQMEKLEGEQKQRATRGEEMGTQFLERINRLEDDLELLNQIEAPPEVEVPDEDEDIELDLTGNGYSQTANAISYLLRTKTNQAIAPAIVMDLLEQKGSEIPKGSIGVYVPELSKAIAGKWPDLYRHIPRHGLVPRKHHSNHIIPSGKKILSAWKARK